MTPMETQPLTKPPKSLMRAVGRAIADYDMVREGDRIMIGVSGGKDSLTLLHILRHLSQYAPVKFQVAALTVDPEVEGFNPSTLKANLAELGVPYFYEEYPIKEQAEKSMKNDSFCSFCSRMKRGIMYSTLRREGYNVLALGQHLDDLAESFLLSAFHGGQLRTMKAHYLNNDGDIRIIRPLVYVRENQTADFAKQAALPVIPDSCPACFALPTQREHMKQLLRSEERQVQNLYKNLLHAMRPLMTEGGIPK